MRITSLMVWVLTLCAAAFLFSGTLPWPSKTRLPTGLHHPVVTDTTPQELHEEAILADGHNDVLSNALMRGLRLEDDLRGRTHSDLRSEEHTSEIQSLMLISYAFFSL